jgi:hypothetical protein
MTDIARIFAEDPLGLSDKDVDVLVAELRARRSQYNAGASSAGKIKVRNKDEDAAKATGKLNLMDLLKKSATQC